MARARGITLIETLVAVAIVAVLAALILPALSSARESARRAYYANNLKQLGLALQLYHDAVGCLPPGRARLYDPRFVGPNPPCSSTAADKSLHVLLLPYLEQANVYNAINQDLTILGPENQTLHTVTISTFTCPSDPASGIPHDLAPGKLAEFGYGAGASPRRMASTSYEGCTGPFEVMAFPIPALGCRVDPTCVAQNSGCFHDLSPIRLADVADGSSHTIFMAERSVASLAALTPIDPVIAMEHGWFITGNWGDTVFTTFYPPATLGKISAYGTDAHINSASSGHPGGLHVLMGDGSGRFVRDSIDTWPFNPTFGYPAGASVTPAGWWSGLPRPGVWQALSTRSGGDPVGGSF